MYLQYSFLPYLSPTSNTISVTIFVDVPYWPSYSKDNSSRVVPCPSLSLWRRDRNCMDSAENDDTWWYRTLSFFMTMQGVTPLLSRTSCAAGNGRLWNIYRTQPIWVHVITISLPKLLLLLNDGYVLQLWPETIAVRRLMICGFDDVWWPYDNRGRK